jgi:uncharacterized protein (DUF2147 family)
MKAFILGWLLLCPIFSTQAQPTLALASSATNATLTPKHIRSADAILGEWLDDQQTVRIQVYKTCDRYHARIVWLKDGSIAKTGTKVLEDLQYTQKDSWQKGRLFYPRTDSWYDCRCTLHDPMVMKVRVYIGTPLFGKTIDFKRVTTPEVAAK